MSKRPGGFESQSVIFIDTGNCSDIHQCVNFARQYGLDIQKVLDSIIVSRPFNIHQLVGLLINELDTTTILQRFGAKLIVISDILKMFVQDSQIDQDEARWLVKEIAKSLRNLSSQIMVVISVHECPPQYQSLLLSLFENQIDIAATRESSRLHFKISSNLHNRHENGGGGGGSKKCESSSFVITERELKIFPAR